jgi:hypothetical protein
MANGDINLADAQDAAKYMQQYANDISRATSKAEKLAGYAGTLSRHFKDIGQSQWSKAFNQQQISKEFEKITKQTLAWAEVLKKNGKIVQSQIEDLKTTLKLEEERTKKLTAYADMLEEIDDKYKRGIADLRAQGKQITANAKEWAKAKFGLTKEEGLGQPGAGGRQAAKGYAKAHEIASSGGAGAKDIIGLLGPWGMLINMFIGVMDKARKMGADLQISSGATGEFSKGVSHFTDIAISASTQMQGVSATYFGQMGMNAEEVLKGAGELAQAGIKISSTIGSNGIMTKSFKNMVAFSAATGQSLGAVGKQFATFTNTFRLGKDKQTSTYKALYDTAKSFASTFEVTMGEMIGSIMSVAEAGQSMGLTLQGTADVFQTLKLATAGTKVGLQDITKAATQLTSIGKADKGWLAFMGHMGGGASGGFLGGLGAAEQRGPGFMGPNMSGKDLDVGAQIDMMSKALAKSTGGMSGPGKQFMTEQLAGQFGLDEQTTQIMQKMQSGGLSRAGAIDELKKLQKQAADNKISSKGLLDILMDFLQRALEAPLMGIFALLKKIPIIGGGGESAVGSGTRTGKPRKLDSGGDILSAGLAFVHGGESVVPAARTRPRMNDSYGGGSTPVNIKINVSMNESDLKRAFDTAHKKTLSIVRRNKQRAN